MPSVFPPLTAPTLPELAAQLNMDATQLGDTIERINAATGAPDHYDATRLDGVCTSGLTPDKTNWAPPLDEPPFHAYPLRPGITFTYLGLVVDEDARVQYTGGDPVSNLFAAGEIMAGNILGQGYCAGTGMTIGGVFGRIAGQHALSEVSR